MARALSVTEFDAKKFDELNVSEELHKFFGKPESNFSMIWYGKSGNGKTEGAIIILKRILQRYPRWRALYNSFEQGFSKSLQDAFRRQSMIDVKGQVLIAHKEPYLQMVERLKKKKSPQIIIIDSIQYIRLTYDQWKELRNLFPRKVFIMIAHSKGDEPEGFHAQKIEYDVDIKVLVKGYQAWPKSRFGGNEPFMIWEEGYRRWLSRQKTKAIPQQEKTKEPTPQLTMEMQAV
jgi:hypothetical protein